MLWPGRPTVVWLAEPAVPSGWHVCGTVVWSGPGRCQAGASVQPVARQSEREMGLDCVVAGPGPVPGWGLRATRGPPSMNEVGFGLWCGRAPGRCQVGASVQPAARRSESDE